MTIEYTDKEAIARSLLREAIEKITATLDGVPVDAYEYLQDALGFTSRALYEIDVAARMRDPKTEKCPDCGKRPKAPHPCTCPYQQAAHGKTHVCYCCDQCYEQCRLDS